jgi:hypothetical protein
MSTTAAFPNKPVVVRRFADLSALREWKSAAILARVKAVSDVGVADSPIYVRESYVTLLLSFGDGNNCFQFTLFSTMVGAYRLQHISVGDYIYISKFVVKRYGGLSTHTYI